MTFFLITTDHLETRLWFLDDDDFKTGMNYVATVAFMFGVRIIAFILMSNHVHFVLECTRELALRFITEFKRLYSRYLNQRHGTKELLRGNGVDIQELRLGDESLERAIAYVQMNCVAANICLEPAAYPWGTGRTFFQPRIFIIRESFSAHTAHHGFFFIRICRSKRMIFKFIMAFIASVKFLTHRAFVCDYVELRMIMNAPALLVRQFSIDFFRKDFHVNHLISF